MGGRPTKLTPEIERQIVGLVRGGVFITVAARACGIGKSTLFDWIRRGAAARSGKYHEFRAALEQARAQARASAELEVRKSNPLAWLREGPGRTMLDEPGWTTPSPRTGQAELNAIARDVGEELGVRPEVVGALMQSFAKEVLDEVDRTLGLS